MRTVIIAALLFLPFSVRAIGYVLDGGQVLPLQISKNGPTRVSLVGEKVVDLFFYPEEAVQVVLHPSGNVFIVPNQGHDHLHATVMGETGVVQDLKLTFKKNLPEPIELRKIPQPDESNKTDQKGKKHA